MEAMRIITLSRIFSFGIDVSNFFLGFINTQESIANIFKAAARIKNEFAVPFFSAKKGNVTLATKNGNIIALVAEPRLFSIFIAPETMPEFFPPISIQNVQLGATVISTPKIATPKQTINANAEMLDICVHITRPIAEIANPSIAGILLDAT